VTRFLGFALLLSLCVAACAPIHSEVRDTVVSRGPVEQYRSPPSAARIPVVLGLPTDSSVDLRVELVQHCMLESRQGQRIRRKTTKTAEPNVHRVELIGGMVLTSTFLWGDTDGILDGLERTRRGWMSIPFHSGLALLVAGVVDIARSRETVRELDTVKSHTDVVPCVSHPAGPIRIVVRFSDGTLVDTQLDLSGTVSVPIPASLLAPDAASSFAEVAVGGAWRARIQIPRRGHERESPRL
jgi:hypothetical protein